MAPRSGLMPRKQSCLEWIFRPLSQMRGAISCRRIYDDVLLTFHPRSDALTLCRVTMQQPESAENRSGNRRRRDGQVVKPVLARLPGYAQHGNGGDGPSGPSQIALDILWISTRRRHGVDDLADCGQCASCHIWPPEWVNSDAGNRACACDASVLEPDYLGTPKTQRIYIV